MRPGREACPGSGSAAAGPLPVGPALSGRLRGDDLADANRIVLVRGEDGLWRFGSETVRGIEQLYGRWRDRPIVEGLTRGRAKKPFSQYHAG